MWARGLQTAGDTWPRCQPGLKTRPPHLFNVVDKRAGY
jgi:hypothetical protein